MLCLLCAFAVIASSQTTQGLISGRLLNSVTGRPIGAAKIVCATASDQAGSASAESDAAGYYYLPLLSPGVYRIRVTAKEFQSQEVEELTLPVAARIDLEFHLRPLNDVWESGQYRSVFLPGSKTIVTFFGPDVDPSRSGSFDAQKGHAGALESTVSEVITADQIAKLPLAGRDAYTMLVTQPAVTSDAATARGLGLSVNGQRPSASNFLLDGVENNNYVIAGPLTVVPPEFVEEYRVSTNNYSAQYGRTSGLLANVVTRSGTNGFHGLAYLYVKNEALNANAFQSNLRGAPRAPIKETSPGFLVGGPVRKERLFFSSSFERFRSRGRNDPQLFTFPVLPAFFGFAPEGRESRKLLEQYAPPAAGGPGITAQLLLSPTASVDRTLAIERLDYVSPGGRERLLGRVMVLRLGRPDFIWNPYKDFISPLRQNTESLALSYEHTFRPNLTNEARGSYSYDDLGWDRPHPEIPTLASIDGVSLPGSLGSYSYKSANGSWQFQDNLLWARGPHLFTVGAGMLQRASSGYLTIGQDAQYIFNGILSFALDRPAFFRASIARVTLPTVQQPDTNRRFSYRQYFAFVQDVYKLTSRLTVNYGVRYELFGAPSNSGPVKDALVRLGQGSALAQQLAAADLSRPSGSADQKLFADDRRNWAVRLGASYDLSGDSRTLLRGAYGIFYDRPYDNIWQNLRNNNLILPVLTLTASVTDYLAPPINTLRLFAGRTQNSTFPVLTIVDPALRNGYAHTYFAGLQQRFTDRLVAEVNAQGSYARRLVTTDIVNRDFATPLGRANPNLPDIAFRSNQGSSDYSALTALLRYRGSRAMAQVTYTWSHVLDNQSDPLVGDFFNPSFTSIQTGAGSNGRSAFSREGDPAGDRADSDFDQRQNLVFLAWWDLPSAPLRGWTLSTLAAVRSGFPYSLIGPADVIPGKGFILNNRPDLVQSSGAVLANPVPVAGGERLLNQAAFAGAAPSTVGNLGRNAFRGPGLFNVDISVGRRFPLRRLGDQGGIRFRADLFNILNHANLNNPDPLLTSPTFGVALYGRQGRPSGFPAVNPLNESARQIQLSVRVEF